MKNIIFSIILVCGLAFAPTYVYSEENLVETVEVVEESTEEANPWGSMLWAVLSIFVVTVGGSVKLAGKLAIKKLENKIGFDIPDAIEEIAEGYLAKAVGWTENWAKEKSEKPSSENKMAETIRYAIEKAGENEYIRKTIEEKGTEIVEKLLKSKETPDEATPKSA